jgi:hypothetical protein
MIKLIDYVRVAPDPKLYDLSKKDKIVLIDNAINNSTKHGLIITYDLSHSARKINNRIYTVAGQQNGIKSLLTPYAKPILQHHDGGRDPIGRFIRGTWQDLSPEAIKHFNNLDSFMTFKRDVNSDDPERIYKALKKNNLLKSRNWPGLGRMRVQAKINDKEAIEKFLDGRYITFSAGSTTDRHVCSICMSDWAKGDICEHRHGKNYDGETCVFITGDFVVLEGSVVNMPADDLSQIQSMEFLSDGINGTKVEDSYIEKEYIYLSDSIMNFNEEVQMKNESNPEQPAVSEEEVEQTETSEIADALEVSDDVEVADQVMTKVYDYIDQAISKLKDNTDEEKEEVKSEDTGEVLKTEDKKADEVQELEGSDGTEVQGVQTDIQDEEESKEVKVADTDGDIKNILAEEIATIKNKKLQLQDTSVDWYLLDAALNFEVGDKALTTEARNELPDSVFCGPERSFPVHDCAHVTAAKRLIGRAKLSEDQRAKVLNCIDTKAKEMSCESSQDSIKKQYEEVISQLKEEIETLKTKVNKIEDKNEDNKIVLEPVENPSVATSDQSSPTGEQKIKSLGSYEQQIVDNYKTILNSDGEWNAQNYFNSKAKYLPKGFHPKKYLK